MKQGTALKASNVRKRRSRENRVKRYTIGSHLNLHLLGLFSSKQRADLESHLLSFVENAFMEVSIVSVAECQITMKAVGFCTFFIRLSQRICEDCLYFEVPSTGIRYCKSIWDEWRLSNPQAYQEAEKTLMTVLLKSHRCFLSTELRETLGLSNSNEARTEDGNHQVEGHLVSLRISQLLLSALKPLLSEEARMLSQYTVEGRIDVLEVDRSICQISIEGTGLSLYLTTAEVNRMCRCCTSKSKLEQQQHLPIGTLHALMTSNNACERQCYVNLENLMTMSPKCHSGSACVDSVMNMLQSEWLHHPSATTVPEIIIEDSTWNSVLSSLSESTENDDVEPAICVASPSAPCTDVIDKLSDAEVTWLLSPEGGKCAEEKDVSDTSDLKCAKKTKTSN